MNFLKRIFLSLFHRLASNIILVLVIAVVATLVLSGISIRTAAENSMLQLRKDTGATITLHSDTTQPDGVRRPVPLKFVTKLSKFKEVKNTNRTALTQAQSTDFHAINEKGEKKGNGDVLLYGICNSSSGSLSKAKFSSGRKLFKSDMGKPYAVISQEISTMNRIGTGGTITLSQEGGKGRQVRLTVVGVYNAGDESIDPNPIFCGGNKIYTTYGEIGKLTGNSGAFETVYKLDDPINVGKFESDAAALKYPGFKHFDFDVADAAYERMSGPLSSIGRIASVMSAGILIAGIFILSLIVILSLRGRKYEIGVLLSIGEKRMKIILQMALEILIPVLVAFTISIFTGRAAAGKIGDMMYKNQVQSGRPVKAATMDVSITPGNMALLYLSGVVLALVSAIGPVVAIMKYDPKDILTKIE